MAYLVLRLGIWTAIFTCLFWRLIAIAKIAVQHLQRLHEIPCSKCAYFTGDYRLKCTVQPRLAMSSEAISCNDFLYRDYSLNQLDVKGIRRTKVKLLSLLRKRTSAPLENGLPISREPQNSCRTCIATAQCTKKY